MKNLGEFEKNSIILLELLTVDNENAPIFADFPPIAVIEYNDGNSLQEVDSVTLETVNNGNLYQKSYTVPEEWAFGVYQITYIVTINSVETEMKEAFTVIDTTPTIEPVAPDFIEPVSVDGEILPADFQVAAKIEVEHNKLILTLNNQLKYNHTYTVVLDSSIRSINGNTLGQTKTLSFTSEYKPFLATPLEVRAIMKELFSFFQMEDIYAAIRNAGQKAFQYLGRVVDANNSRYREYTDRETTYFETTKYVAYEASRTLITNLMLRLVNGGLDDGQGYGLLKTSIQLGDFSLGSPEDEANGETLIERINLALQGIEKELKFWQDAMMGRNRRGYSRPASASFRSDAGSPEGRDFE